MSYGFSGCQGATGVAGVAGATGMAGAIGIVGGTGYLRDDKLEKLGIKLVNIYNYNEIYSYNILYEDGRTEVITQEKYDSLYNRYIRKLKINEINENKK